jgi:hypothetical protein
VEVELIDADADDEEEEEEEDELREEMGDKVEIVYEMMGVGGVDDGDICCVFIML